jgi:hypothetical protein
MTSRNNQHFDLSMAQNVLPATRNVQLIPASSP